jgi:FkbM family methyltransferase
MASELRALVRACRRLRRPYAGEPGDFLVAGDPAAWPGAAAQLRADGQRVVACWDSRWRVASLRRAGARVLHGALPARYRQLPVLFAGRPHKRWFNGPPDGLSRCRWQLPPDGRRATGPAAPDLLDRHGAELDLLFDLLFDDASRAQLASLVRGRVEGCTDYYRVAPYREYAHPRVRARPGDVVLDVGAYTGWSTLQFLRQLRGRGSVVALEPLPRAYRKLARLRWLGARPLHLGAWDRPDELAIDDAGAGSQLGGAGEVTVPVRPIDDLVGELGLSRVDLVKLDVEGAELRVLEGAEATLRRFRPRLAISIYHRPRDLWELPLWLHRRLPGYRYYLGHHNFYQTETDLYAEPIGARWWA